MRLVGTVGATGKSFALKFHVAYAKAGCAECHSWDKWTDFISDVVKMYFGRFWPLKVRVNVLDGCNWESQGL